MFGSHAVTESHGHTGVFGDTDRFSSGVVDVNLIAEYGVSSVRSIPGKSDRSGRFLYHLEILGRQRN